MKEYKVVAVPHDLIVQKGQFQRQCDIIEKLINDNAKLGWTYHSMSSMVINEKPYPVSSFEPKERSMLIFVRDK